MRTAIRWAVGAFAAGLVLPAAALAAGAGEHAPGIWEGGIGNSIVTLIVFGGVVFVLGRYAWGPLMRVLAEREQTIRSQLEDARRERQEAQALLAQYQRQLEKAREDATAIVEEGRRDAEAVRLRIHSESKREADEMIARARREISLATDAARTEVFSLASDLALDVARRVVRKELSDADHADLVRESIEAIRSRGRMN